MLIYITLFVCHIQTYLNVLCYCESRGGIKITPNIKLKEAQGCCFMKCPNIVILFTLIGKLEIPNCKKKKVTRNSGAVLLFCIELKL